MMRSLRLLFGTSLLALSAAGLADAPADNVGASPRTLIEQGNALYADGRYAEALETYDQAAETADAGDVADLLHNRAATYFKLGQIDDARELWARARPLVDSGFEARARYNLGNCDYADALAATQEQQPDPQKTMNLLNQAAEQYRAALGLDPTLDDARANLELAHILRRQIEEQMQNQPQSQPSSDQSQQDDQSEQDGQSEEGQQQPSSQPASQQSQSQPSESDQQQQPQTQPADQEDSQQEPGEDEQQQDGEEEETPDSEDEQQQQEQEQEVSAAESQPSDADPQSGQQAITMTREQAERLLQKVRDAEKARREALARRRAQRQEPVERDW